MESTVQLSLPLFDPPTFDELLQRRDAAHTLSIIANRRLKRGWRVTTLPFSGKRQLTIPSYLIDAPEEVKNLLIDWALFSCRLKSRFNRNVREHRSFLERSIWRYIDSLPDVPRPRSRFNPCSFSGKTFGRRYDLREIFDSVNRVYFNKSLTALVRWGRSGSKTSYHTVKNGANGQRFNLIIIADVYNNPEAPRFAIEGIMHHEMLHIAVPPYKKNGRSVMHGKEFKNSEVKFAGFKEWRQWERQILPALLRQHRRK
jgi:predicted SprT family Zn-dependent metalloprotease